MGLLGFAGEGGGKMSAATSSAANFPFWVLLLGGTVAVLLLSMAYDSMKRTYSNLPPGPRNWPVIGALLNMEPKLHDSFTKLAKKYGPIVYLRLGVQHVVVVSTAEIAEELMKHKDAQFAHRSALMSRTAAKYAGFEGQMWAYSDNHTEHILRRKLSINEFFTLTKLKTYDELRRQEIAVMVEKVFNTVESASKSNEVPKINGSAKCAVTVNVRDMLGAMVRNIIFALVFGERFDRLSPTNHLREFPEIMGELLRLAMAPNAVDVLPFLTWFDPQGLMKKFKALGKKQGQFYEKIISDRRRLRKLQREDKTLTDSEVTERNFVDVLLNVQEESGKLSDNTINGTLVGILSAGIDSTSAQIEWIFVELARHPEVLQKLQAEVDGVVGMDRPVDENDVQSQNMPYLHAVVKEVLRLHPIVPVSFPHGNKEVATLAGYTIPANTAVLLSIPSIGRDPKVWKDPLQFNPERFMGAEGAKIHVNINGTNFDLLPFASGRRGCPAYTLAWVLLLRTTAALAHAFDWSPPSGLSPKDISAEETGTLLMYPVDLFLTPTPRVSCNLYQSKAAT